MDALIDVSVVIPARNAAATLGLQLAALSQQDYSGTWEIVLADNGSTDATLEIVRHWQVHMPHLRSVTVPELGVGPARNTGIAASRGQRVLLCDADDEVSPGWVSALDGALETADLAAGPLEYDRLNPPDVPRPRPPDHATTALPRVFGRPYGISANLGLRRPVFDANGGFDESFGVGGDDVDFCWRSIDAGYSLVFAPRAVVHYRLRSSLRSLARQQYQYARGGVHLYSKHQALGLLPRRDLRSQLRGAGSGARDLVKGVTGMGTVEGRHGLALDAARLAGSLRGALEYRMFI